MHTAFANALKQIFLIAVASSLIGAGWGAAIIEDGAKSEQTVFVSVNRINKGDQLSSIQTSTIRLKSLSSPALHKRPPLGCDPVASSIANPLLAHIYKRCLV
jgi:hypothetical protein